MLNNYYTCDDVVVSLIFMV